MSESARDSLTTRVLCALRWQTTAGSRALVTGERPRERAALDRALDIARARARPLHGWNRRGLLEPCWVRLPAASRRMRALRRSRFARRGAGAGARVLCAGSGASGTFNGKGSIHATCLARRRSCRHCRVWRRVARRSPLVRRKARASATHSRRDPAAARAAERA